MDITLDINRTAEQKGLIMIIVQLNQFQRKLIFILNKPLHAQR